MPQISRLATVLGVVAIGAASVGALAVTLDRPATSGARSLNAQPAPAQQGNIVEALDKAGHYKTFIRLLGQANLTLTLQGSARFTVFAPTDEAFAKLSEDAMKALTSDSVALRKALLYHIVSGELNAITIRKLKTARSMEGTRLDFVVRDARQMVNNAVMTEPDLKATNGIIHGIDTVLQK